MSAAALPTRRELRGVPLALELEQAPRYRRELPRAYGRHRAARRTLRSLLREARARRYPLEP